ncbi:Serine/Threonine kinase domain protein (macronuclear) [Tetrahymena thermophila SB210]|uniref:Serine/Threonine kinase domain protein n=1 Tax=Tetrahymena thermophila (strain SB210) TaxID=312017 RepID=Q22SN3_TETTS|nr:Serine/Threonine kinase domain protein [Tetrahymena thermophila SB210]EAR87739.2 Serine/Threonine kinase domain protein [Tetrahymena thermophila SB210]|eukprot:XP_001007984.2 Serine/Threonine kinase domain protein [Tetrahymena thermophila SB210]
MQSQTITQNNHANPQVWTVCNNCKDYDQDTVQFAGQISDSKDPFSSVFGEGFIRVNQEKITFSQQGFVTAFIKILEQLTYSTLYNDDACYLKLSKFGKETFVKMSPDALDQVDKLLKNIIFKQDFSDSYEVISFVGNGSFSQVTLAKNKRDSKNYAVKSIQKNRVVQNEQSKKELMNEINLLRRINHEKVVKSYEFFQTESQYKLVLHYYEGGSLEQKLEKSKGFTLFQICDMMRQILQGFSYLHQNNIMHRDLKPDNILFFDKESFDVVISDMGLSQDVNENFVFKKCGTPGYVAPEILNSITGTDYGVKSDIFSCGCLFYRLVMGQPLFEGKSHVEVLEENRKCKIDLSSTEFKKLPQQIQKVIENMLQINPEKRISAQEALDSFFYRLNAEQQQYFCKNLQKAKLHQRKNTGTQIEHTKLNSQNPHKQRQSVQIHNLGMLNNSLNGINTPKGSCSSMSSNNSLPNTPTSNATNKDKQDVRKSQYCKQTSLEVTEQQQKKHIQSKEEQFKSQRKNSPTKQRFSKEVSPDTKKISKIKLLDHHTLLDSPINTGAKKIISDGNKITFPKKSLQEDQGKHNTAK